MPLQARFSFAQTGNTVPYPPTTEGGRSNAGFIDLRGHPERVDGIHEARLSPALARFLRLMARDTKWVSLGCDIGSRITRKTRHQHFAGGYIQFTHIDLQSPYDLYEQTAENLYHHLYSAAANDDWHVHFSIAEVAYTVEQEEWDVASLFVWFDAGASTIERATASRERLLDALRMAVFHPALEFAN